MVKIKSDLETGIDLSGSRLKRLTIQNFRCIGSSPVSIDMDKIVVLVGPNNVGKSTILRAYQYIMNHQNISDADFPNGKFDEKNPPSVELQTWLGSEKPGNEWLIKDEKDNYYIRERWIWGDDCKPTRQGWSEQLNTWSDKVPWGAPNIAKARRPKPHRVEAFALPQELAAQVAKLLIEWIKEDATNLDPIANDGISTLEKIKTTYKELHEQLVENTQERVNKAESSIGSLLSTVLEGYQIKFDVLPNDNADKIIDTILTNPAIRMGPDGGHLSDVKDQGSGAQRTLLWAALKFLAEENKGQKNSRKSTKIAKKDESGEKNNQQANRPNVLLIDEPEICLHPSAVRDACKTLYDLADGETNWQVMVTTHSPVFIDFSRDHTTVVKVQRDAKGIISGTTVFRPDKAELTEDDKKNLKLLNLWDPYVAEFFFGGKTILVEGDTEYVAFKLAIENDPGLFKDIHIIRARGKAILVPLIKILNHFGQSYAVLHDADTPITQTKTGAKKNSMWTENEKIKEAANLGTNIRLVAAIQDFETAIFREGSKSDKPYTIWTRLRESPGHMKIVSDLLMALIHHSSPLPENFLQWSDINELESAVKTA